MSEREDWLRREPETARARTLGRWAWMLSAVVLVLVASMRRIHLDLPEGWSFGFLPPIYSGINAVVSVLLVAALVAVKRGRIGAHRSLIRASLLLSLIFLIGYVAYHLTTPPTRYAAEAPFRGIYLGLLITHIILAAVSFPFILFAYISGTTNQFVRHRRLVRWVFPMWLWVAVTGPVCFLMLSRWGGG